jgi:hypothetical protein
MQIFKPSDIRIFLVLFGVRPLLPNISPILAWISSVYEFIDILFISICKFRDIVIRGSYLRNKELTKFLISTFFRVQYSLKYVKQILL